ncbi:unnamed protein product [Blepharisma stoltei]|uniref:MOSC domain-containing protein n=1 Tax=Blepharisma stoltei TaxID=1481888 RepID=A0AAU9JDE2_9CILI|nr:unnamed protein product [Blepharisma stoltei]
MEISYIGISMFLVFLAYIILFKKKKTIIVSDIICYPIKSCQGVHLESAEIGEFGFLMDREWSIATYNDEIIDCAKDIRISQLKPSFLYDEFDKPKTLVLSFAGFDDFHLEITDNKNVFFEFTLAETKGLAADEGDEVSKWLSHVFNAQYRLIRLARGRQLNQHPDFKNVLPDEFKLNFASKAQFLIISKESFEAFHRTLSKEKQEDVNMANFRPSIVVENCSSFYEDNWKNFDIDGVRFHGIRLCGRCKKTTIIEKTLQFDPNYEPVNSLRKFHGNETRGFLGLLALKLSPGTIRKNGIVNISSFVKRDRTLEVYPFS